MSVLFQGKLIENLSFGHLLQIGGRAENKDSWLSISLALGGCGEVEMFDIPFHMLVDVANEKIEFKQLLNGQWLEVDSEEFETEKFRQHFSVTIAVDEKKFYVAINGESLTFVRYTGPQMKLAYLMIDGNLITLNQVDHRKYFALTWPPAQICQGKDGLDFTHDIPCPLQPGNIMVLTMKLLGKADGWLRINFHNATNSKRIEVHINLRFNLRQIIRNSKLPKKNPDVVEWGDEETKGDFPFDDISKPFKLALGFTKKSVKMAKDGIFLFKYGYRTAHVLPRLTGAKITGQYGMIARVLGVEHLLSDNPKCKGFEQYSDSS
uniref:Galectin n=1 Tax=Musca domestica TaxID=7370 RepID=A0A1I8MUH5_MUSDO